MNKVKPTAMQIKAFQNLQAGMTKEQAMLKAGYTAKSARNPKTSLMGRTGIKTLIEQYREDLKKAGVTKEVLAEVQARGLKDNNAVTRFTYLKESKKDLGIEAPEVEDGLTRKLTIEEWIKND